jgi:hypothetical protein
MGWFNDRARRREFEGITGWDIVGCGGPHTSVDDGSSDDRSSHELSDEEYKEFITGSPAGVQYRVQDPATHLIYDFDGFANGYLVWTIADYERQFDDVGSLEGGIERAYVDTAGLQESV